ncbi:HAD-IB family hydrolase [Candidatus Atribacteria bacterium HGW-Atribacteria-1]|nr:MAG: HAD-IB family hydrolase [Candidatus Atribacteria bacterium HGW-Atribacteria-1]
MKKRKLVIFDFDGTITNKDSFIDFIKFAQGTFRFYFGLLILSPTIIAYLLSFISNNIAKEKLISHFFKGCDSILFRNIANKYSKEQIDKIVRPKALEKIKWHQDKGHKIVIVSASMECWLSGWCEKNKLELIATKLESENNRLTGKFSTKNCNGIEKVNRIKENYNLEDYEVIYAYGDSKGDNEMLSIADKKYYKYFE